MKQINRLSVVLLILIMLFSFPASANQVSVSYVNGRTFSDYSEQKMPDTTAKSISVYNKESGFIIYEKNPKEKIYPASTVKIMTAIVAYENIPDKSTPITVTRAVVNESIGLKLGLQIGDVYTAEDLIRAVLICGSNDAANQLAEYVSGGKKSDFIALMNKKAKELGCTSTNYTNVTGLHDANMYTTASDLMKIAIYAYELEDIAEWSSVAAYSFYTVGDSDNYKLRYNRNDFISRSSRSTYYYKNAFGLNSGSTPEAGNCLVTSASKNGMTYICVIMNSPVLEKDSTNYAYTDAKKLLDTCFSTYEIKKVLNTNSVIAEVPLNLSASYDHVPLFPSSPVSHILPVKAGSNDISYEKVIYGDEFNAPINQGDEFGEIIIKYKGDFIVGKSKLISNKSYERSTVLYTIDKIKKFVTSSFFIVTAITAIVLFGIYTYFSIKSKRRATWINRKY